MSEIILNNVMMVASDLFKPGTYMESVRYGCALVIKKNDPQLKAVQALMLEVAKARWPSALPPKLKYALKEGLEYGKEGSLGDDTMFFKAYRARDKGAPLVLDRDAQPTSGGPGAPHDGCFVNAKVQFYVPKKGYDQVAATLSVVQFRSLGTAFGGTPVAKPGEFNPIPDEVSDLM